ncbi:TspO/MBR family protein [Polystyrenella longa]|uniref:TspO/MBR family protein n=2 Tax=Polystyrenella longa TaxID=2528007 RepID=A0A518CK66_9PLAN|nr:TspO/MBR family protein [Polystyrenella longa]
MDWYENLAKPEWTPSGSTISLIWQILYPIILVSFGFVFVQVFRKSLAWKTTIPFVINLIANVAFTPIMFGLQNLKLAACDILIVWTTILWIMIVIWKHYRWIAIVQIPYFIWVSIATYLQLSITLMNW